MLPITDRFDYDFNGNDILYGRNRITDLGAYLDSIDRSRAMIVCGSNVGSNDELIRPITSSLGDRLVHIFDETTPAKSARTIFDGIDVMRSVDPDVLIGVGGGSSLDIARQMSVFETDDRTIETFKTDAAEGTLVPPEPSDPTDVIVIPTTFAGADLSSGGSFPILTADESPTGQPVVTKGSLWPRAYFYDPTLFETTPLGALAGSAMNGFNKGVETIYANSATPVSDATSIHALKLLHEGFQGVPKGSASAMDRAVIGMILVQLERKINLIHAFGHGFSRRYPVQQGEVHAVLVAPVLRYLFDKIDARRSLIAEAFGIDTGSLSADEIAESIITEVEAVRDSFELPTKIRDLEPVNPDDFPAIAEFILNDHLMPNAPDDLIATADEIETVLHEAW